MRVGADGTVLAANDGALMLLGGRTPAEALGRDFAVWVPPEQHDRWRAFTLAVVQGSPSSIECDIAPPSGDRYPTLFHAIPLTDHPDGVASMAVAARVISAQRQLEAAIGDLTEQLNERGAQLQARDEALAMAEGARRAAEANCARALADVRQLELALNDFASRQQQVGGAALQEAQQALASSERRGQENRRRSRRTSAPARRGARHFGAARTGGRPGARCTPAPARRGAGCRPGPRSGAPPAAGGPRRLSWPPTQRRQSNATDSPARCASTRCI